jgi:hypothetical protein
MQSDLNIPARIRQRREEIARRTAAIGVAVDSLERELEVLRREDEKLAIVEGTLAEYAGAMDQPKQIGVLVSSTISTLEPERNSKRNRRKPEGVPSILRMVREILRGAAQQGQPWVTSTQIVSEIQRKWWPEVKMDFVYPQIWRAANRGTLIKSGMRYALPHTIEKGPPVEGEPSHADDTEATAVQAVSVSAGGIGGFASDLARQPSVQP